MSRELKYEAVKQYLRDFPRVERPYDFGGLLDLMLSAVENLRENLAEGEIREHAHFITDAQAGFLQQLLEGRADSIEWFKDDIGHSSQTGLL